MYAANKEDMLAAGELIMCRYILRTEGFESVGAHCSVVQHGMLQCRFNKANKIAAAEMIFDVMGFMQQLQVIQIDFFHFFADTTVAMQRATAISPETSIVPNTIEMALQPSTEVSKSSARHIRCITTTFALYQARAIVKTEPPFLVVHINEAWTDLSGHSQVW